MIKKNEADFCREFGLESFAIQTICKNRTKIINAFEHNGAEQSEFESLSEVTVIMLLG